MSNLGLSLLVDATQVRDMHSGVARRLVNLWQRVEEMNPDLRLGFVTYDFMVEELRCHFAGHEIFVVRDFGVGPKVRDKLLNPRLSEIVVENGFDWIHQDGLLRCGDRSILTIHDLRATAQGMSSWWRRLALHSFLRTRYRHSITPLVTVSESMRNLVLQVTKIDPKRLFVVANGIDVSHFAGGDDADFLKRHGLTDDNYRLFIGHLEKRKNPLFLIKLHQELQRKGDSRKLVFAFHDRPELSECLRIKRTLASVPGIVLCPSPTDQDLGALYRGARCFLMPSLVEGFSMTPLEALALGTPAVVANIPPHVETLGSDFCVDLDIATWLTRIKAMEDAQSGPALISRGLSRASSFSWQRAAEQMTELLRCLSV